MRSFVVAIGLLLWQNVAPAQTNNIDGTPADNRADTKSGVSGATAVAVRPEFTPLTASERWKLYFTSTFGPGAIARAVVGGGIAQRRGTPKEWAEAPRPLASVSEIPSLSTDLQDARMRRSRGPA